MGAEWGFGNKVIVSHVVVAGRGPACDSSRYNLATWDISFSDTKGRYCARLGTAASCRLCPGVDIASVRVGEDAVTEGSRRRLRAHRRARRWRGSC